MRRGGAPTDYANGVQERPTPVEELLRLIEASKEVFGSVLPGAVEALARRAPTPPGVVYRFEE